MVGEDRSRRRTIGAIVTIAAGALASYGACALPAFQKHLQSYLAIDDPPSGFPLFSLGAMLWLAAFGGERRTHE